jgi:hypothetical protein
LKLTVPDQTDRALGSCCERLRDELNARHDHRYLFERDGMLTITVGYNEAANLHQAHWVRAFARHCPFCGEWIMPESARRKN